MKHVLIAVLALAAAGCGGAANDRPGGDAIVYEAVSQAGRSGWRIDKDGAVTLTGDGPGRVIRRFSVATDNYLRIEGLMQRLARFRGTARGPKDYGAGVEMACDSIVSDQVQVTVTWEAPGGQLSLARADLGCRSDQAAAIQADLQSATRLVEEWAAQAPVDPPRPGN